MMNPPRHRVLGIDPSTRLVSFAVLEAPDLLIAWGMRTTDKADSDRALRVARKLIEEFKPQTVAIEDSNSHGSRKRPRIKLLLDNVAAAVASPMVVRRVPMRCVADLHTDARNKYERACVLAKRFPELQPRLPRFRKPW